MSNMRKEIAALLANRGWNPIGDRRFVIDTQGATHFQICAHVQIFCCDPEDDDRSFVAEVELEMDGVVADTMRTRDYYEEGAEDLAAEIYEVGESMLHDHI